MVIKTNVKNLNFFYEKKMILKDINMDIKSGDFVCILGQSGCGKSTFLRLLAGLEKSHSGEILLDDRLINGPGLERGIVFQDYGLFPWMTSGENIMIALKQKFKDMDKKTRKLEALKRLKDVGLDESVFNKLPKELSGGMKQRCAIARAFGIDPPILLMDEPFGALDAVTRAMLQDLVLKLWENESENRKTIFFVTHDVEEAIFLATDIIVLGQSPSTIIYNYSFNNKKSLKREDLFDDPEIMKLRNELVKIINNDVQSKI